MRRITIAIDGHSSCGKSTLAKDLARELGYIYIDTGAMYRAVALALLEHGGGCTPEELDDAAWEAFLGDHPVSFSSPTASSPAQVTVGGEVVEGRIRNERVAAIASHVASVAVVRRILVDQQRRLGADGGVVMDGRDIGTVVFPHAELKLFVTADVEERGRRRQRELAAKGEYLSLEEVVRGLAERDRLDEERTISPLRRAPDAHLIDNTSLTPAQQLAVALGLVKEVV